MEQTLTSLDKSLSVIIEGATEKGAKLVDWLFVEAPEVVQQILIWNGVESGIKFLFGLVLIIGWPILCYKVSKKYYNWYLIEHQKVGDDPGYWVPTCIASVFSTLITQLIGWHQINFTWLKIWIAPKIYIIEYIGSLTK